ncbi:hypothetical protein [Pseudogemmobacter sonorensis]|uniref:hypothetical protein n=1 Tax=Pseudogemmobacter sonorensis TaxID=2989681 RepID=UPI0036A1E79C
MSRISAPSLAPAFRPSHATRTAALALAALIGLAAPVPAQVIIEPFAPNGETTRAASGPYARYLRHVLKLSAHRYAVLFEPGYTDGPTSLRAVAPLCAAQGRVAELAEPGPGADLVVENGVPDILLAVRVDCR